jgi:sulfate adenylyltransferase
MADLIAPHGGLSEPVDRTVPADRQAEFRKEIESLPTLTVSDGDLSSLYRFGDGGLSPLTGPMTKEVFDRVLTDEVIIHQGKKYAWSIPIAFPVAADRAKTLKAGETVALVNAAGERVGRLAVADVYPFEKLRYLKEVYQSGRVDHPGAKMTLADDRNWLVGGEVEVLPQPKHAEYGKYVLTPRETRKFIAERKWEKAVAFQTRNALHRAHEFALVVGLERLVAAGHFAGAVLNPLIGETKSDDVDALTRMRTYKALVESGAFGEGDVDEKLWASKPFKFKDQIALIGLDIKMFYAGPKEAIMHGIYRQNFGFTHIVIGRKHADAPYDDGTDIWDGLAAQRKFDTLGGELLIQPVKVGFAAFFEELGRVGLVDEYGPQGKGFKTVSISGRDLRQQLQTGTLPDPRIMRRETAEILIQSMKAKA